MKKLEKQTEKTAECKSNDVTTYKEQYRQKYGRYFPTEAF